MGAPTDIGSWLSLAALVAAALGLLYLLRPRRRRVEVPFGGLWRQVLAQSQARTFGRRWQRLWSFLLFLAVAGAVLGALGEPLWRPEPPPQRPMRWSTLLAVDVSASMATLDGRLPTTTAATWHDRLAEARREALRFLDTLPADEAVAVLAASGHTAVLAGWGSDRDVQRKAIAAATATDAGLDLRRLHLDAEAMLRGRPGARVVWVSDTGPPQSEVGPTSLAVQWLAVGPARDLTATVRDPQAATSVDTGPLDDLEVRDLRLRPVPGDRDVGTLTVQVLNRSDRALPARLAVRSSNEAQHAAGFHRDATLRLLRPIVAPPGESRHEVADLDLAEPQFAVHIEGAEPAWRDRAPWNDWAFAAVSDLRQLQVLVVGDSNQFLRGALLASGRAEVTEIAAEAFAAHIARAPRPDVVLVHQAAVAVPAQWPVWTISVAAPSDPTRTGALLQAPDLLVRAGGHPTMRGVSFQDTNFDTARTVPALPGQVVLAAAAVAGRHLPVLVATEAPVRQLWWGLDLLETDLVARISMPILAANALAWLAGDAEPLVPALPLGRPWAVELPNRRADWRYREPGVAERPARIAAGQALASSERHGIHVWVDGQGVRVARASDLPRSEDPRIAAAPGPRPVQHPAATASEHAFDLPRWAAWLLAALVALTAEWLLYLRRRTL
ncbi:MAG: VWA domain-containing protein [Deltaproteobacteria bacterium]|nr:VWA domain-containing protein [Deltaproteobacteria bacterium]